MLLQAILNLIVQLSKFNTHPDSAVACSNHAAGLNLFRVHPERDSNFCAQGQKQKRFNITATAAHVSGIGLHMSAPRVIEANLKWEQDFVPGISPPVFLRRDCAFVHLCEIVPGALLLLQNLHPGLDLPSYAAINYPNYFEP